MKFNSLGIVCLSLFFFLITFPSVATATHFFVHPGDSIQDTINDSSPGDTIIVYDGYYEENIEIDYNHHHLTIQSTDPETTYVRPYDPSKPIFSVESSYVNISGFKVIGSSTYSYGIYLNSSHNCNIENNTLYCSGSGVHLSHSSDNHLSNNTVRSNSVGISIISSDYNVFSNNIISYNNDNGIHIYYSGYNNLFDNIVADNGDGIAIYSSTQNSVSNNLVSYNFEDGISLYSSDCNYIYDNIVSDNEGGGISIYYSEENNITENTVECNDFGGLRLYSSRNNLIFNNYLKNAQNALFYDSGSNLWNVEISPRKSIVEGIYIGGNFWGTPEGTGFSQTHGDANGDNICEEVYILEENNIDYFPLTYLQLPVSNFVANVTLGKAPLTVKFTDLSSIANSWFWEFGDGTNSTEENPEHTYDSIGIYDVTLTVTNENLSDTETKKAYINVTDLPHANFTANITTGYFPLNVKFTDLSINADSWLWKFGDGTTSTERSPTYTYEIPGTYNVSLTITNEKGTDAEEKASYINVKDPNSFYVSVYGQTGGFDFEKHTEFIVDYSCFNGSEFDTNIDRYTNEKIDLIFIGGDNNFSLDTAKQIEESVYDGKTVVINFYSNKIFSPSCLPAYNLGTVICGQTLRVVDPEDPITEKVFDGMPLVFSNSSSNCNMEYVVKKEDANVLLCFEDEKPGLIYWKFGNGYVIEWVLEKPEYFINDQSLDTVMYRLVNHVLNVPVARFSSNVTSGEFPLTVQFTDQSSKATAWDWDFGDGNTSGKESPIHTYTNSGIYDVRLTVTNEEGSDTKEKLGYITVVEPIRADFICDVTLGYAPLTVQFTDLSTGNPTCFYWDFGDGNTSNKQNPKHVYTDGGCHEVNLTVSNYYGINSKNTEIFVAKPIISSLAINSENADINDVTRKVIINASLVDIIDDKTILIRKNDLNISIDFTEDGLEVENNNLSGNYVGARIYKDVMATYIGNSYSTVFSSFNATLSGGLSSILNQNASIRTTIIPGASDSVTEDLILVASTSFAKEINVFYSIIIDKEELDGVDVRDAYIVMTAEKKYVDSHGGPCNFTIMSVSDEKVIRLDTTFSDKDTFYEFTAFSPEGFSIKSLVNYVPKVEDYWIPPVRSGGSGSGGGALTPEDPSNIKAKELSQQFIVNGIHVKFGFPQNETIVQHVEFDSKRSAGKTKTIVEMLKGNSSLTSIEPEGVVYEYLNIWVGNSGFSTPKNIENAIVIFRVDNNWINDNNINESTITMWRYDQNEWHSLATSKANDEKEEYICFKAKTPAFSPFAITGKREVNETEPIIPENETEDKASGTLGNNSKTDEDEINWYESIKGQLNWLYTTTWGILCSIVGVLLTLLTLFVAFIDIKDSPSEEAKYLKQLCKKYVRRLRSILCKLHEKK